MKEREYKKNLTAKVILSACLLFLFPLSLFSQSNLINTLNHNLIPIKALTPEEDFSDLKPLKTILKDKYIIGLGEATHGTKEFFLYKHRLVRFLVTELGFKTFVIEADFAGTQVMNDYVVYGKGNPYSGLKAMGIGVWMTQEFVDMVEWVKQYNSTKTFSDKVKFYGCDMQLPIIAAKALKEGTIHTTTELTTECKKGLDFILNYNWHSITNSEKELLKKTLAALSNTIISESDSTKSNLYKQYIRTIAYAIEYISASSWNDKNKIRDKYMAKNCEWIYYEEKQNKMIIWAHNGHIAKNPTFGKRMPMGHYLSHKFSKNYYAFGFGFNSGTLRAHDKGVYEYKIYTIPNVQIKKSSDYIFSQCSNSNFILDFQSASTQSTIIKQFLNKKIYSRFIGAIYDHKLHAEGKNLYQALNKMYNGIIFFRETSAATPPLSLDETQNK